MLKYNPTPIIWEKLTLNFRFESDTEKTKLSFLFLKKPCSGNMGGEESCDATTHAVHFYWKLLLLY